MWGLVSSIFYVFGGALFIAGSVYVVPGMSNLCVSEGCSIDVALWYLVGCLFYFFAAIIDLTLSHIDLAKRGGRKTMRRVAWLRFDSLTESIVSGWIYFFGSILFTIGSVLFFPALNARIPARLTFRAGSCMYITGSGYGIIQLLFPSRLIEERRLKRRASLVQAGVRRRTMTRIESLVLMTPAPVSTPELVEHGAFVHSQHRSSSGSSDMVDESGSNEHSTMRTCFAYFKSLRPDKLGRTTKVKPERLCNWSLVLGITVKLTFIVGSSSFLTGGVLFSESLFLEGAYLWLEGSFLFLLGALISLGGILYDMRKSATNMHTSLSSSATPDMRGSGVSKDSSGLTTIALVSADGKVEAAHDALAWTLARKAHASDSSEIV